MIIGTALVAVACGTTPVMMTMAAPIPMYEAHYIGCHDGDTCTMTIELENQTRDLGFNMIHRSMITMTSAVRLCGINAPELDTPLGPASRDKLNEWLKAAKGIMLEVYGNDKYGRVLARIIADETDINQKLIKENLAVPYMECK